MTFIDAVKTCYRKYAVFSGRAGRAEYWYLNLFIVVTYGALWAVSLVIPQVILVLAVFVLASLLPGLSVSIRRLHDVDQSAWVIVLLGLIPILGQILLIVWLAKPGTEGENRFGGDPIARDTPTPSVT